MKSYELNRRDFVKLSATAIAGGLLIGILPACDPEKENSGTYTEYDFNAYIRIDSNEVVTIMAPVPDMGQGTKTALPAIAAEEMGADWEKVRVIQSPVSDKYQGQSAAGSDSIKDYWQPMREAGAAVRELLISAASAKWKVARRSCDAEGGMVRCKEAQMSATFGELAESAATFEIPDQLTFKDPGQYQIVGRELKRADIHDVIAGKAIYGIDVRIPDMYFASVEHAPVFGGKLLEYDASETLKIPAVVEVVKIEPVTFRSGLQVVLAGIAVIAKDSWSAFKGREALKVKWDTGEEMEESSSAISKRFQKRIDQLPEYTLRDERDAGSAFKAADKKMVLDYEQPFLGHVCMEPINCTAKVLDNECEIWAPTQNPQFMKRVIEAVMQIDADKINIQVTKIGGGFGRRLAVDYGLQAALISRAAGGKAVQLIWKREDNVRYDFYRSANYHRIKIEINQMKAVSWQHHLISKPIANGPIYEVQGAADLPYNFENIQVGYSSIDSAVRIGSWRSVAHSYNVFATASALDEIAAAMDMDPYRFHLKYLGSPDEIIIELPLRGYRGQVKCDKSRLVGVLNAVAKASNWKEGSSQKKGLGIACCYYKDSYAAHVVELERTAVGSIRILKIWAALDCGRQIDPSGLRAQIEGAAMDAINVVFNNKITIENGLATQSNFHDLKWTGIRHAPPVQSILIESDKSPSGAGEPPFPSAVPAITNAIFNLTGERIRKLPADSLSLAEII